VTKEWIPYEGPRGGEGWQSTNDREDTRYGLEDPPGEVAEGYEDMAEDWGESHPELSDYSVYASPDSDAFEQMQPHLEEILETGEFDNGAVSTNIQPVTDEDEFDQWDMDGETPETKSPTALGYLYADTKMPVEDFINLQEYIGEGLNTWSVCSFCLTPVDQSNYYITLTILQYYNQHAVS